jgi:Werner syndrome ATP-dependent helicase
MTDKVKDKERQKRYDNYKQMLEATYGFNQFRSHQIEIIDAVVHERKDTLCIMFTGAGKSLCYQLPALIMDKVAIVVSPLISLMEDQKVNLEKVNINACAFNSSQTNRSKLKMDILSGKYKVIYITPETIVKNHEMLEQLEETFGISLFAVDEAHCVSMWGADFRPRYKELDCLKQWFPHIPIMALTGTATLLVEEDIISSLSLIDPTIFKSSLYRSNLYLEVKKKTHALTDLLPHFKDEEGNLIQQPTIVYCQTRTQTEDISKLLIDNGVKCGCYHAGLGQKERKDVHHKFLNNELDVIVSTIAFGMGIDKKDIRKVIHYGCPKDMESYYQEFGRAGRDRKASECCVYYARGDFATNKFFLKETSDQTRRDHQEKMIKDMEKYLFSSECRWKQVLAYFGEEFTNEDKTCCDNCANGNKSEKIDFGKDALMCLQLVKKIPDIFGKTKLIKILRGLTVPKLSSDLKKSEFYGAGKEHSEEWWKCLFQLLLNEDYLKEKTSHGSFGTTIILGPKAMSWIIKNKTDPKLELEMTEEMKAVNGEKVKVKVAKAKPKFQGNTFDITYDLFQKQKKDIKTISKERDMYLQTIDDHIVRFIKLKKELDYDRLDLTDKQYEDIIKVIYSDPINGDTNELSPIKDKCPKGTSYFQIKASLAIFETDPELVEKLNKEKTVKPVKKDSPKKKKVKVV